MNVQNVISIPFNSPTKVTAFYTLSTGGFSQSPYSSFNLADHVGDSLQQVAHNRELLAIHLKINSNQLIFANQTHSSNVKQITDNFNPAVADNTDGLVTSFKGLCLCVLTADCIPILFYDNEKQVIGAAHAGWRGTVNLIALNTLKLMTDKYHCNPCNISVYMGPGISGKVYEVGVDLYKEFKQIDLTGNGIFTTLNNEKYLLDLKQANKQLLVNHGVLSENIVMDSNCTFTQSNQFFSARRSGIKTGRLVTGIMLKN